MPKLSYTFDGPAKSTTPSLYLNDKMSEANKKCKNPRNTLHASERQSRLAFTDLHIYAYFKNSMSVPRSTLRYTVHSKELSWHDKTKNPSLHQLCQIAPILN